MHAQSAALGMIYAPLASPRRGGRSEYTRVCPRAVDMPSAMPVWITMSSEAEPPEVLGQRAATAGYNFGGRPFVGKA